MTEILFYHLERTGLDSVLPGLLEKCLERHWQVTVRCGAPEVLQPLDNHLWTYKDDSFLPHGIEAEEGQPITLTAEIENEPNSDVLFLVEGADAQPENLGGLTRCIAIFDGAKEEHLQKARALWKSFKDAEMPATYWKQSPEGRWVKQA